MRQSPEADKLTMIEALKIDFPGMVCAIERENDLNQLRGRYRSFSPDRIDGASAICTRVSAKKNERCRLCSIYRNGICTYLLSTLVKKGNDGTTRGIYSEYSAENAYPNCEAVVCQQFETASALTM
ncbi:hypothetical protein Tco_1229588 [Tanacetum coccineum]